MQRRERWQSWHKPGRTNRPPCSRPAPPPPHEKLKLPSPGCRETHDTSRGNASPGSRKGPLPGTSGIGHPRVFDWTRAEGAMQRAAGAHPVRRPRSGPAFTPACRVHHPCGCRRRHGCWMGHDDDDVASTYKLAHPSKVGGNSRLGCAVCGPGDTHTLPSRLGEAFPRDILPLERRRDSYWMKMARGPLSRWRLRASKCALAQPAPASSNCKRKPSAVLSSTMRRSLPVDIARICTCAARSR